MHLLLDVLRCWRHGFSYKTGAEPWFKKHCVKENRTYYLGSQRNPME